MSTLTSKMDQVLAAAGVVNRFEAAVRAHETKGAQHPEDFKEIEDEFEAAHAALGDFIIKLLLEPRKEG